MAVYRNDATLERIRRMLQMFVVVGIATAAIGIARAIVDGPGPALFAGIASGIVGVIALVLMRRSRVVAVETGETGVEVRNLFSTRRYAWDEVEGFGEEERRRGMTNAVVRLRGGRVHALSGVGDPSQTSGKLLDKLKKELRASRR